MTHIEIPFGYCHCGCGEQTKIATKTERRAGWVRGQPIRFIKNHSIRRFLFSGADHHNWNGGRRTKQHGYVTIHSPHHPHANKEGYVYEHILMAMTALGKALPQQAKVHHINGIKSDNDKKNLVICQDAAYHALLHTRTRALRAAGNPNYRQCRFCRVWEHPMHIVQKRTKTERQGAYHQSCANAAARADRAKRNAAC